MSWTHTRSQIAHLKKRDPDADTTDLRRQLRAERLEEYVARIVAEAPPLTDDQRSRIAALLQSKAGSSGDDA